MENLKRYTKAFYLLSPLLLLCLFSFGGSVQGLSIIPDQTGSENPEINSTPVTGSKPIQDISILLSQKSEQTIEGPQGVDYINVKWFGAKGDGATDDTRAIQAAINRANGDRPVVFPSGEFVITDTIVLTSGTKLYGNGIHRQVGTRRSGTIIRRKGNRVGFFAQGQSTLKGGPHLSHIELKNIYFSGENQPEDLVRFVCVSDALIERCHFQGTEGRHLLLNECYDSRIINTSFEWGGTTDGKTAMVELTGGINGFEYTNQIHFENCRFESYRGCALKTSGNNVNEIFIHNTKFESLFSTFPHLQFDSSNVLFLDGVQVYSRGQWPERLAEQIRVVNSRGIIGTLMLEHGGLIGSTSAELEQYILFERSGKVDLKVIIYDNNYDKITNKACVKSVESYDLRLSGFPTLKQEQTRKPII